MDLGIEGKRALILASSRGLGLGVATALAAEGVNVLITGRNEERLAKAAAELNRAGPGKADILPLDFSAPDAIERLVSGSKSLFGTVDILVNNTGGPPPGPISAVTGDVWTTQFEQMVRRIMTLTAALLPGMREQGWGRILTIASSGIVQPIPNLGISNSLRAALAGWSKTLADEIGPDGVTINMLLPGRIHTERVDELDKVTATKSGSTPAAVAEAARATIPIRRYGTTDEFGAVAAFLLSAKASYVTGSVIRCDGGATRSV